MKLHPSTIESSRNKIVCHKIVARGGEERLGRLSYIPRMSGIILAVAAAFMLANNPFSVLMITLFAVVAAEIGFSIWSTTTTSSLLKMIPAGKEGSVLGVNSAITGAGLLVGSIMAGEIASTLGYGVTFTLAIAFLGVSFLLVSKYFYKTVIRVPA